MNTKAARALCDGFRGRFFFDAGFGDLAFVAENCDHVQCRPGDDDTCSVCIGDMDHGADTGEPIAKMLNALPHALDEIDRLRRLLGESCEIGLTAENPRSTREECAAFYERLFAIRQEAGGGE